MLAAARWHKSRGAALRQLGLHARAEIEDDAGLACVRPSGDAGSRVLCAGIRIGLVADAIGRDAGPEVETRLAIARADVDDLPTGAGRDLQSVRLAWVEVEHALSSGVDADASTLPRVEDGRVEAPAAYAAGSTYHLAKGLLFAGVVARDITALDHVLTIAPNSLVWAAHLARADLGVADAPDAARAAWRDIGVPPDLVAEVAATPTGVRLV